MSLPTTPPISDPFEVNVFAIELTATLMLLLESPAMTDSRKRLILLTYLQKAYEAGYSNGRIGADEPKESPLSTQIVKTTNQVR